MRVNSPGADAPDVAHLAVFYHLEATRLVVHLAEIFDRKNLLPRLKIRGRHPVACGCDLVAEAAGHAPWREDANRLDDRQEERLARSPGTWRVGENLDLGQVQVAEELLGHEVRQGMVLEKIVSEWLVSFRTNSAPA